VWRQILDKVKASAMTNLLMCEYVCGFLAALGRCLCGVSISYVNFFKLHIIISGSIKSSRSMCCLSYYSSAGGLNKPRLCKLVLMFRFLWISAGPTYSALPVNAKEVLGDVRFRQKLLFHCWSIDCGFLLFIYLQSFFRFRIVLAEYFYSLLCLFGFLVPDDQVCMGWE